MIPWMNRLYYNLSWSNFMNKKGLMKIYIDEAWRWPLAWPMYIGIIHPTKKFDKKDFKDSKKLTEKKRKELFKKIVELEKKGFLYYSIWIVNSNEIDELWMTKAQNLAIKRGLSSILNKYSNKNLYDDITWITKKEIDEWQSKNNKKIEITIDWNRTFWIDKDLWILVHSIIKWDDLIKEISIASIIAKVNRDKIMKEEFDKQFPLYNFKKHKWYWTKEHRELILKYWPCEIHRKLFLKKIINNNSENFDKKS